MWDKTRVYSDMISFLCLKKDDVCEAWKYVELAKSRTLLDFMRFVELSAPQNIPENLLIKEKELMESIKICDRLTRKTEKADEVSTLSQKIIKLQSELNKLYDQIEKIQPEYVDIRRGKPLPINGINDMLKNQSKKIALVEYYIMPEKIFIFVMKSKDRMPQVKIVDISSQDLTEYVSRYFEEIHNYPLTLGTEETWQNLAEYLIVPVFDDLNDFEILYLIPHGLLHYLPIHALSIRGRRLIEYFPVIYSQNLTAIKYAQEKGTEELNSCLSMGFTPNENEKRLFEGEASLVARLFKKEAYLGKSVTNQLLINAYKDVIHLSCHGFFDSQNPLNSGLLLSDGILTVKDIFNMDIATNLLVLTACETGLNKLKPGDELIGLTRAFLYSGAKSILVSLWSVSADSTLKLMESFYKNLINNTLSKAEALQKAQMEMIHSEQYSHPYYWASFILIGDWK